MEKKFRLVVFSKYQITRCALRHLLAAAPDLEIVAEVGSLQEAERAVVGLSPNVVLVETIETTNAAIPKLVETTTRKKAGIVVLTHESNPRVVRAMLRAGVSSYIVKRSSEAELFLAIRSAACGRKFLDSSLIYEIALEGVWPYGHATGKDLLSNREFQVLQRLAQGQTSPEIARDLQLSKKTVQTYRSRIYEKLELRSRSELVQYAINSGLISLNA